MPVTSSVTGCSTCRRVLTSRKEIVPSWPTRNSHGAGADVAGLAQDRLGGLVELGRLLVGEERRGRLLDQLLVAALQRAVAGGDDDDVAVLVGQALGLDVPGLVEVALDEALAAAEGGDRLADRGLVQLGDLLERAGDLEAASAAAERGLDRDRAGRAPRRRRPPRRRPSTGSGVPGDQRRADPLGDVAGRDLVAEVSMACGRRADPGQAGVDARPGRTRRSRRGSRSRGARRRRRSCCGDVEQLVDVEVGLGRGGAAQRVAPRRPAGRAARRGRGRRRRPRCRCRRPGRPGRPGRRSRRGWRSAPSATA